MPTKMETKTDLLVLAAGMGSRYGGLKQMDPMGPHGETMLDYSIFDAIALVLNGLYSSSVVTFTRPSNNK